MGAGCEPTLPVRAVQSNADGSWSVYVDDRAPEQRALTASQVVGQLLRNGAVDAHLTGPAASALSTRTLLALRAQGLRWTLHTPAHRYNPAFFHLAEQVTVHPASRGQRRSARWGSATEVQGRAVVHTALPLE